MLKIKIKVKHLALSLLAALVLVPLLAAVLVPQTKLLIARAQWAEDPPRGKQAVLEALSSSAISAGQKRSLIRDYMIGNTPDRMRASDYDLYVGPNFTQMSGKAESEPFSLAEKIPYLEQYVHEAPADGYLFAAAKHLAYCLVREGETERAIGALGKAAERLTGDRNAYSRGELILKRAELTAEAGRTAEAERMLADLTKRLSGNDTAINGKIARLRAQMAIAASGSLKPSLERVQAELNEIRRSADNDTLVRQQLTDMQELLGKEIDRRAASASVVSGTVKRSDGRPLANVGVFLREASIVNRSVTDGDPYQTVTDPEGRFSFDNVAPGSYQLYLGLDYAQISGWTWPVGLNEWIDVDGAHSSDIPVTLRPLIELQSPVNQATIAEPFIDFRWQPVEGAAYYNVNAGVQLKHGSGSTSVRTHVADTHLRVPIRQLYELKLGVSYDTPGDWSTVDPADLLGFMDPNNRFFWGVEAYDANGKLLTKSAGYRLDDASIGNLPFFYIKQRELTETDRKVAQGSYDEALLEYREAYESNPNDVHSLYMTVRLLQAKAAVTGDDSTDDEAYRHLQKLVAVQPAPGNVRELLSYEYDRQNWTSYNDLFERYDRLREEPLSSYEQSTHATALLKQGKPEEAKRYFAEAMNGDGSHRFVGNYIAAALYADKSAEAALQIAQAYPERPFGQPARDWPRLVRAMIDEAGGDGMYFEQLNEKLDWHFEGRTDLLRSWILSTNLGAMKAFVQAVMNVN